MNQRGCPVCEFWARVGTDGTFDAPHHATCPVPAAAVELLLAAKEVLADLNARIDAAPDNAKPVFRGIAALDAAVNKAEGR